MPLLIQSVASALRKIRKKVKEPKRLPKRIDNLYRWRLEDGHEYCPLGLFLRSMKEKQRLGLDGFRDPEPLSCERIPGISHMERVEFIDWFDRLGWNHSAEDVQRIVWKDKIRVKKA